MDKNTLPTPAPSTSQTDQRARAGRTSLASVVLVSFIIGALSGGIFGVLGASLLTKTFPKLSGPTSTNQSTTLSVQEDSATVEVVNQVAPSVVSVILTKDLSKVRDQTPTPLEEFFPFFQPQPQKGEQRVGAGTGFIVSADGLILTNRHVVDAEDVDVTVIFSDGSEHQAAVVDIDPFNDLAFLKIDAQELPVVELGDSDAIQLGQTVIAIGNPLEFRNTVTKGVVSGINRTIVAGDNRGTSETIEEAIQTDAAINPGNSGGPLINLVGQVVGVNTAVSREGQLIGFAIPINTAKQVIESVQQSGKIVRPYLGVRYTLINKTIQQENNLPVDYGALVVRGDQADQLAVIPGSPADKAGLEENDIILEFNNQRITPEKSLATFMRRARVGEAVTLKVLHDGKEKTVEVTLEEFIE